MTRALLGVPGDQSAAPASRSAVPGLARRGAEGSGGWFAFGGGAATMPAAYESGSEVWGDEQTPP